MFLCDFVLVNNYSNIKIDKMQSDRNSENYSLQNLIYKIKRLKKKLYSYGWNKQ